LENPGIGEAAAAIERAWRRKESCVLAGTCRVIYEGRAKSFLDWGDRLLLLKNDGTFIVHKPSGNNPANWMRPGCDLHLWDEDGALVIRLESKKPAETMRVEVRELFFVSSSALRDGTSLVQTGTEADLAKFIMQNPSVIDPDFVPSNLEEQTKYGFLDVYGRMKSSGAAVIIEVKRYTADLSAVSQLRRYVERVRNLSGNEKVLGFIAAPAITKNALKMLRDFGFEFRRVEPPEHLVPESRNQSRLLSEYSDELPKGK